MAVTETAAQGSALAQTPPEFLVWGALAAAVVILGLGGFLLRQWLRRRAARSIPGRLRRACDDMLADVLVADPDLGAIHLQFVLFNRHGVTVVDVREARGHVFGSESMDEWTVLARDRRYTFANPLPAMHDRVAAIRRLVPEMPVQGYVAFTTGADFSKGQPPFVTMFDELIADMARRSQAVDDMGTRQLLQPLWERLKREVTPSGRESAR